MSPKSRGCYAERHYHYSDTPETSYMAKKIFVTYLQKVGVASLEVDFAKNIFSNESKK